MGAVSGCRLPVEYNIPSERTLFGVCTGEAGSATLLTKVTKPRYPRQSARKSRCTGVEGIHGLLTPGPIDIYPWR